MNDSDKKVAPQKPNKDQIAAATEEASRLLEAPQVHSSKQSDEPKKMSLLNYIGSFFATEKKKFSYGGGCLTFLFPKRQQKEHKITIGSIVLAKKRLTISFKGSNCEYSLATGWSNDQLNITLYGSSGLLKPAIEPLEMGGDSNEIRLVKITNKRSDEYYDDVMSYFFSEIRPEITIDGQITAENETVDNSQFQKCLLSFWPKYDSMGKPAWPKQNVTYRIEPRDSDDTFGSENKTNGKDPLRTTQVVAILLIAFLRRFIISGMFDAKKDAFWKPAWVYLTDNGSHPPKSFIKKPDVDLAPIVLEENLIKKGLHFEPALLDTICTALNAGDNIILTGCPGCGKTTLAREIIDSSGYGGIVATASSAWTTDELIGRYMPKPYETSTVLSFQPGFFIEAIKDKKWLLIDEMNRAPIDLCFGELFTVLSGQSVELPFLEKRMRRARIRKVPGEYGLLQRMTSPNAQMSFLIKLIHHFVCCVP